MIYPQVKPQMPKLVKWLQAQSLEAFWRQTWRQKTMPDMASRYPAVPCNQLTNFGIWVIIWFNSRLSHLFPPLCNRVPWLPVHSAAMFRDTLLEKP